MIDNNDLVKWREDDGVWRVLGETDVQRCSVFCVRVGLNSSYWVQHLLKFIWSERQKDGECVSRSFHAEAREDNSTTIVFQLTGKWRPAVQDDISSLQLAFVVKHHGVDPSYRVVLQHNITFNTVKNNWSTVSCDAQTYSRHVSYHFACFADSLVLVYVSVFGGFLLLYFIHDSVDGEAEASHTWQIADGELKLQCGVFPRVVWAPAALAAHCGLTQKLCPMEEPSPHLDLKTMDQVIMRVILFKTNLNTKQSLDSCLHNTRKTLFASPNMLKMQLL